ncbi:tripartite motif-containing protein 16-like [Salarias fasciatus]|uniref:Tripartite motif-containing protein 16-like n=1 Tax=Salarias fasciatus TaxID=181472 RepID=A0A672JN43_SALFA|nr:tripartite motif-containing protein 16-like [Salarias fasciatus]XP_029969515.1 tripartite motif-containing protein 16-like [Salarias fasciatus]
MASDGSLPEEQFLCSICLDMFSDPVSTPCGHNYCKTCITGYWDSSGQIQCPICKQSFGSRPQLQVNTGFRDMVKHLKSMRVKAEGEILVRPGEVPCDICVGPKLKAQKTCLVCLASYCEGHLEPHLRVASFKKHKLTEPVPNLEDRVCTKHDKMLELFCQPDQVCICFMCLKDDHVGHKAVPLEQAHREKAAQLQSATSGMKIMEEAKSSTVKEVKDSIQQRRVKSDSDISSINAFFALLVASLKCRQSELIGVIQEKQKEAETEAERRVAQLEQELAELRRRRSKMEQLLQTEDNLHLLQNWPSLHLPTHTEDLFSPAPQQLPDSSPQIYAGIVKKAVERMGKAITNEMELLLHEVRLSDSCEVPKTEDATEEPMMAVAFIQDLSKPEDKLAMIQQCHTVNVKLNVFTVSTGLALSEDGKRLGFHQDTWVYPADLTYNSEQPPFVLATEGYSSGKFYYEVQVHGVGNFWVGVVNPTVSNKGCWILALYTTSWECYSVFDTSRSETLFLRQKPERVGVFVDYENKEVSFYDMDAKTLIYSFTGCNFTDASILRSFLSSMAGGFLNSRQKLFPAFSIFGAANGSELVITHVAETP